jgi:rhamnosyltransferase
MSIPSRARQPRAIALGFVVYREDGNLLLRLRRAHAAGWQLYVFDNSPELPAMRDACRGMPHSSYFTAGRNVGLAEGIAWVCQQAYNDGFAALLFFDQDTIFDVSTLDFVQGFHSRHSSLGVTHTAVVFNAKRVNDPAVTDSFAYRNVLLAISSGSLFYLANLRRIGWHSRAYFVDCVDYEFCLNSRRHGFLVGECSTVPGYDHVTEQADHTYTVFGQVRHLRRYPRRRVADSVVGCMRLCAAAARAGDGAFVFAIARYLAGYLWWQLMSRVLRPQKAITT